MALLAIFLTRTARTIETRIARLPYFSDTGPLKKNMLSDNISASCLPRRTGWKVGV